MANTFKCEIITPEKVVYSDSIRSVTAEGYDGSFGVLAGHAPLIAELQCGILTITDSNNQTLRFALDGGFFEVFDNSVVILTDMCAKEGEVDIEKVRAEKEVAEKTLSGARDGKERERAQASVKRADTWLRLANK
jgi:F-type H+-transporting ATPase subunit epsilon